MIAKASNAFGWELWKRSGEGNLAMSPASISIALVMTYLGARGETAAQMHEVLRLDLDVEAVAAAWGQLANSLEASNPGHTVRLANRLFAAPDHAVEPQYVERIATAFDATLEPLDFTDPGAVSRINRWVAERTENRISNLIGPGVLDDDTHLVLVNAIYFLGRWATEFVRARTQTGPFWLATGGNKPVAMMRCIGKYRIATLEHASVLELPYRGDRFAMYVVLPSRRDGLASLEQELDADKLAAWRAACTPDEVEVALPRFTIDLPTGLRLEGALQELGMQLAFDQDRADFNGIATPANQCERVVLSTVVHKAFVKVDEEGTIAAAAAAVTARMITGRPRPRTFIADHPFLFLIVDQTSDLVLFLGRVVDPVPLRPVQGVRAS